MRHEYLHCTKCRSNGIFHEGELIVVVREHFRAMHKFNFLGHSPLSAMERIPNFPRFLTDFSKTRKFSG
jgi:hypothetical protein